MSGRVLIVDDEPSMCEFLEAGLGKRGFVVASRRSAAEALDALLAEDFDLVVTDLHLKGMSGIDLCDRIATNRPDVPVIVLTAFGSLETAVAAIRAGAYDFLTKPVELETLRLTVERAIRHRVLSQEVRRLRRVVAEVKQFDGILGESQAMTRVYDLLDRIAGIDTTVLVSGESGTGKEMVARSIHKRGKRAKGPFVAINCAAMAESLLESELFGHEKGAFTDAKGARAGLFVRASGGTLFLDEIGELSMNLQPKLLRAIQERSVRPVGSDVEVAFDARLVVATNRDLESMVEEHCFREDLFYRINVIHVALPPLRARGGDILILAQHFLEHYADAFRKRVVRLSSTAAEKLLGYSWPGNVRELQNCVERATALTRFEQVAVEDLPEKIRDYRPSSASRFDSTPSELVPLEEVERRYILHVLEAVGGSRTLAAQTLGMSRKTLYRKLALYGVAKGAGEVDV